MVIWTGDFGLLNMEVIGCCIHGQINRDSASSHYCSLCEYRI